MTTNRTADLINRLPRWFIDQVQAVEAQAQRRQAEWEETRRRNDAQAKRAELEFLCSVDIRDSDWDEWHDTVIEFNSH